ncbi:MAG TPA: O-antigen ligase family protein [Solirubrobacterales bacterium]|nr:O-antigen ligase family protein [Solirubrobacterales bacterium]
MQVIYRPPIRQIPVKDRVIEPFAQRVGNWFPVVLAAAIPVVFLPNLVDAYILPRASVVMAGACLGTGLALLVPDRAPLGALRWPLVAAVAAAVLAFAFSVSWALSAIGGYTRYESVAMRLAYLGLLAVPVWLLRTPRARAFVPTAVVAGAAISSLWAISQVNEPFRPDGNLGNANLLGALIAMAAPLCLSQMLRRGWAAIGAWVCAPLLVWGLIVSTSRSGAIAALAGGLALLALSLRGRHAVLAAAARAVVVAAAVVVVLVSPLRDLNGDPGPTRVHLYPDALRMVAARPLTGWGEEATGLVFGRFLSGDWSPGVTFDRTHSGPLEIGATQGLIGLAATGWLLLVVGRGLWANRFAAPEAAVRGWRIVAVPVGGFGAALVAYTVWVLFNFDWAPATGVFWLLAGAGWSMANHPDEAPERPAAARRSTLVAVRNLAAALALVLAAVVFAALPVLAEAWYSNGRPDLAVQADPLQAQYRRALGEALLQQGRQAEGLEQLRLAASLGETDPALYVELGDAELAAGDRDAARADYRKALSIDPYWQPARSRLSGTGQVTSPLAGRMGGDDPLTPA